MKQSHLCTAVCLLALAACAAQDGPLRPGANDHKTLQETLLVAEPGAVIELGAGRFELDATLSLDVEGVTLRGQGMEETILDFASQAPGTGGEGVLVTADDFTVDVPLVLFGPQVAQVTPVDAETLSYLRFTGRSDAAPLN